jgi:rare lipoprotein A
MSVRGVNWAVVLLLAAATLGAPARPDAAPSGAAAAPARIMQTGKASWYGAAWADRLTADGERFHPHALTAAHRWLPFGTIVRVTNLKNGRSLKVRINDRGPYYRGRIIDLSDRAAALLRLKKEGVARVRLEVVPADQPSQVRERLAEMEFARGPLDAHEG